MSTLLRRDPRAMFPELVEWFEEPFLTLRPYLAQPIRIEDFVEDDHYMIRAELAGIDPAKDVEVTASAGYLTIRAERHDKTEGKHRTEFRYGSFSRSLPLPAQRQRGRHQGDLRSRHPHRLRRPQGREEGRDQEDRGQAGQVGLPRADATGTGRARRVAASVMARRSPRN